MMMQKQEYQVVPQHAQQEAVIVKQPGAVFRRHAIWMSIPVGIPHCPSGLEYLAAVDQLFITRNLDMFDELNAEQKTNKFLIKNSSAENMYLVREECDGHADSLCGNMRFINLNMIDHFENVALNVRANNSCSSNTKLELLSSNADLIGRVQDSFTLIYPTYEIKNAYGERALVVKGPFWSCRKNLTYYIYTSNDKAIGKISKNCIGLPRELFTTAKYMSIKFPLDLDVRLKASLLTVAFMILGRRLKIQCCI